LVDLYLVRHAKSSWADPGMADIDRPLNKRGKRDAPIMGERLAERGVSPDVIVSSPAKRARRTAREFAKMLGYEGEVVIVDVAYGGGPAAIIDVAQSIPERVTSLMVVGHNPDMTDLADSLTDYRVDAMPTCAVFGARFGSWTSVGPSSGQFEFFVYPKDGT